MKTLIAIALGLLLAAPAAAQCPGGVCPSRTVVRSASSAHWTYPGDIHSHLRNGHGFDASGMTAEQAKTAHDRLHNAAKGSSRSFSYSSQSAGTVRWRWFGRRR